MMATRVPSFLAPPLFAAAAAAAAAADDDDDDNDAFFGGAPFLRRLAAERAAAVRAAIDPLLRGDTAVARRHRGCAQLTPSGEP
jgi:hypothetical protein